MSSQLQYQIALKLLEGVGSTRAKTLVSYLGSVEAVFKEKQSALSLVPGLGEYTMRRMNRKAALQMAETELKFIESHAIDTIFYLDEHYPQRLKQCADGPVLLYAKGNMDLNRKKVVSIVGTRQCTDYGRHQTEKLIQGLKEHDCLVISGLAYGIDIHAHQESVKQGLQTVGVLGHGLDRIYPALHENIAAQMMKHGGVLSEFEHGTKPDRENFPQRNRIVAGMSDVTIVVETMLKGGSMITANLAFGYSRDVAAFPGRTQDMFSAGCNALIKSSRAALIEGIEDLEYLMGWEKESKSRAVQKSLFIELNEEEQALMNLLKEDEKMAMDNLSHSLKLPISKVATLLLDLEFKGAVRSLPGKMYQRT